MRLFRFDDPVHVDASALLAWYANETLDAAEQARVERHVRECVACSREVEELRRLQALLRSEEAEPALAVSRQRTRALLDREDASPPSYRRLARQWRRLPGWARAALVLQTVLVVLPAVMLVAGRPADRIYHSLSERSTITATGDVVVVVFDADRPQRELQALLRGLAARIIDGPNAAGAYTLQLPAGQQTRALSVLRSHPGVLLAESAPGSVRQQ